GRARGRRLSAGCRPIVTFRDMYLAESLRPTFRQQLELLGLRHSRVLVAVSGGPDSVALLDLFAGAAGDFPVELLIAHVDHGVHPASAAVAARVRELAESYGVGLLERRLELGPGATETAARS